MDPTGEGLQCPPHPDSPSAQRFFDVHSVSKNRHPQKLLDMALVNLQDSANYNIISRSSNWNVFCKKGVLEISSKILQKYLWLSSRVLACNFNKTELLHKLFQGFSLDYQNTLFPERLFLAHSWQRFPNNPMLWRAPYVAYPTFLNFRPTPLPRRLQPSPPVLFLMSCFFGWMGNCATFHVLFYLMVLWIYTCWALVP